MTDEQASRRDVLKRAAYVAPAILTLKAVPAYAQSGSGRTARAGQTGNNGPFRTPVNDGPGTSPGNPRNRQSQSRPGQAPQERQGQFKEIKEKGNNGVGNGPDPQPPGSPKVNDGLGTSPGNPGNK